MVVVRWDRPDSLLYSTVEGLMGRQPIRPEASFWLSKLVLEAELAPTTVWHGTGDHATRLTSTPEKYAV